MIEIRRSIYFSERLHYDYDIYGEVCGVANEEEVKNIIETWPHLAKILENTRFKWVQKENSSRIYIEYHPLYKGDKGGEIVLKQYKKLVFKTIIDLEDEKIKKRKLYFEPMLKIIYHQKKEL